MRETSSAEILEESVTLTDLLSDSSSEVSYKPNKLFGEEVSIRALSKDNRVDAQKVVELFKRQHGDNYPFKEVYEAEYWHADNELRDAEDGHRTSIVACLGEDVIAHWALRHIGNTDYVEVLFPALDPKFREHSIAINKLFWSCICKHSEKQKWRYMIQYIPVDDTYAQSISDRCFNSHVIALLPPLDQEENPKAPSRALSTLSIRYRLLSDQPEPDAKLYAPRHLQSFISDVISPVKKVTFLEPSGGHVIPLRREDEEELTTGFQVATAERLAFTRVKISPSLMSEGENVIEKILAAETQAKDSNRRFCVYAALEDSKTVGLIEELMEIGFKVCGALPRVHEHDYIALSRNNIDALRSCVLINDTAKRIKNFLVS